MSEEITFVGKLKRTITLNKDDINIETKGLVQKIQGVANVTFKYKDIKSVEITERSLLAMREAHIEFKVDGQSNADFQKKDMLGINKRNMTENPYVVLFVNKQKDEVEKLHAEIQKRMESQKSNQGSVNVVDDIPSQIKKLSDLKDSGVLSVEEFEAKKKELLDRI
jgi:hypothetical protein